MNTVHNLKSAAQAGAARLSAVLAAVALLAVLPLTAVLLAGCAGAPEQVEEPPAGPDPLLMENAGELIERAAPEHLREAVLMLQEPAQRYPEAQEQAALALALFDILYPQLAESGYLAGIGSVPAYRGRYAETLERARAGRAPSAGAAASGEGFFDRLIPALYVANLSPSAETEVPGLSGYLKLLDQAEAQNPSSVLPPYLQGRIHELQGNKDQAVSSYRHSVERAASFYPGRQRLAVLLLRDGQTAEAVAILEQNTALPPEYLLLHYLLAEAYYQSDRLEEASAAVAQVLMKQPDQPGAMLLRVRILIAEGNWSQALRLLNLLLYQHPDNEEAYLLAARVLFEESRDPEGALEVISEGEAQFPDAPEFPELAGRIYLDTGRSGEGLTKLQRALDLQPGRVTALRLLLSNAMRMRRWLQAAIYLSEILEQEQSPSDLLQAIEIYQWLGDPAQVLYYAEQLYQANTTVENLVIYAQALLAAGQTDAAAALVERGLEQADAPEPRSTLLTLQASLIEEGAPQEALALVREALMMHPQNYAALVKISELYVQQRELRKASLYLKQAIAIDPNNAALRVQLQSIARALGTESTP